MPVVGTHQEYLMMMMMMIIIIIIIIIIITLLTESHAVAPSQLFPFSYLHYNTIWCRWICAGGPKNKERKKDLCSDKQCAYMQRRVACEKMRLQILR